MKLNRTLVLVAVLLIAITLGKPSAAPGGTSGRCAAEQGALGAGPDDADFVGSATARDLITCASNGADSVDADPAGHAIAPAADGQINHGAGIDLGFGGSSGDSPSRGTLAPTNGGKPGDEPVDGGSSRDVPVNEPARDTSSPDEDISDGGDGNDSPSDQDGDRSAPRGTDTHVGLQTKRALSHTGAGTGIDVKLSGKTMMVLTR